MNDVMLETATQPPQTSRMQLVYVSLSERSYVITIGENILREVGISCSKLNLGPRCAIITDSRVATRYARPLDKALKLAGFEPSIITIPAGEKSKNLKMVQSCYEIGRASCRERV